MKTHLTANLQGYCKKWQLENPRKLAETATSHIYRVDSPKGDAALKIFTPLGWEDERFGTQALIHFNGNAAVELFEYDEQAQLIEFVDGEGLTQKAHEDEIDTLRIFCKGLNQIHSHNSSSLPLIQLKDRFKSLIDYRGSKNEMFNKAQIIANELLNHPLNKVVLHGDIHHENILFSSNRGWLFIDPKGLEGESTFDYLNILFNPMNVADDYFTTDKLTKRINLLSDFSGIPKDRMTQFAFCYGCLSSIWNLNEGIEAENSLKVTKNLESLL